MAAVLLVGVTLVYLSFERVSLITRTAANSFIEKVAQLGVDHVDERARSVESRLEAMHAGGLTALVGREEELELLLRLWKKANIGEGQVVLLSGEAGIGKSRLSAALIDALTAEPHCGCEFLFARCTSIPCEGRASDPDRRSA